MTILPTVTQWLWTVEAADPGRVAHLTPAQILAQIHQESGGNPRAQSPAGAQGLMQLMPATARALGVTDPWDPRQNVAGGVRYMGQLMAAFHTWSLALAAYNAGPEAVRAAGNRVPDIPETMAYVLGVRTLAGGYAAYLEGGAQPPTIQIHENGDGLRLLQHLLGVTPDGLWGPETERAIVAAKTAAGLDPEPVVGPGLWSYLLWRAHAGSAT
jgi:peptidoglycan hydrolase-like protein with peptidoglycan-binding domain